MVAILGIAAQEVITGEASEKGLRLASRGHHQHCTIPLCTLRPWHCESMSFYHRDCTGADVAGECFSLHVDF